MNNKLLKSYETKRKTHDILTFKTHQCPKIDKAKNINLKLHFFMNNIKNYTFLFLNNHSLFWVDIRDRFMSSIKLKMRRKATISVR